MATKTKSSAKTTSFATPERASANFTLKFGLVAIPIAMKPLVESLRSQVSGNILCPDHMEKPAQKYLCGEGTPHEHLLSKSDTVIGYETEKRSNEFVLVDDAVLEEIVQERTGDLDIERIAPLSSIDPSFFEKSYITWPQTSGAAEAYDLLAALLRETGKVAICRGVMTKKTRTLMFVWSEYHQVLLGYACAYSSQLRERDLELARQGAAQRKGITKAHLDAAKPILASLDGDFDPEENEDTYTPLLLEAIDLARNGKKPKATGRAKKAPTSTDDLLAALQASVTPPTEGAKRASKPRTNSKTKPKTKA